MVTKSITNQTQPPTNKAHNFSLQQKYNFSSIISPTVFVIHHCYTILIDNLPSFVKTQTVICCYFIVIFHISYIDRTFTTKSSQKENTKYTKHTMIHYFLNFHHYYYSKHCLNWCYYYHYCHCY